MLANWKGNVHLQCNKTGTQLSPPLSLICLSALIVRGLKCFIPRPSTPPHLRALGILFFHTQIQYKQVQHAFSGKLTDIRIQSGFLWVKFPQDKLQRLCNNERKDYRSADTKYL